jgi:hypothetical protein
MVNESQSICIRLEEIIHTGNEGSVQEDLYLEFNALSCLFRDNRHMYGCQ